MEPGQLDRMHVPRHRVLGVLASATVGFSIYSPSHSFALRRILFKQSSSWLFELQGPNNLVPKTPAAIAAKAYFLLSLDSRLELV
jgi:hypothetical protein